MATGTVVRVVEVILAVGGLVEAAGLVEGRSGEVTPAELLDWVEGALAVVAMELVTLAGVEASDLSAPTAVGAVVTAMAAVAGRAIQEEVESLEAKAQRAAQTRRSFCRQTPPCTRAEGHWYSSSTA